MALCAESSGGEGISAACTDEYGTIKVRDRLKQRKKRKPFIRFDITIPSGKNTLWFKYIFPELVLCHWEGKSDFPSLLLCFFLCFLLLELFELLELLATHPGKVYSRSMLLQTVWGKDYTPAAGRR